MQTKPGKTTHPGIQDKISFDIKKPFAADLRRYLGKQKILHPETYRQTWN
jgi:hypothetical protein